MSAFPQELRDLAMSKIVAHDRYNALAAQNVRADLSKRAEQILELEMAYRDSLAASEAFRKALDAYMAKENTAANATEAA